jgi:biopolymer transport protein ExbD
MADISFLLLIFFLVTTSMDVNQGLARRLPPPPDPNQKLEEKDINQRNLLLVKINSANQLMVEGQLIDVRQLREKAKEFILNVQDDENLPKLVEEDFGAPIGTIKYTKDHVISVQSDVETQYQAYLDVQNELVAAYNELREDCAQKYFHKAFAELDDDQRKQVQKVYPQKISEAEPKNYGGK